MWARIFPSFWKNEETQLTPLPKAFINPGAPAINPAVNASPSLSSLSFGDGLIEFISNFKDARAFFNPNSASFSASGSTLGSTSFNVL